jgi:GNAT superfamily N-acetyltransferase
MSLVDEPTYSGLTPMLSERLPSVARRIFSDTFSHLYEPEAFHSFCDAAYGSGGSMQRALADPTVHWRIASLGEEPIGYAKLLPLVAPAPNPRPSALELQQIYVLRDWHGRGIAEELMRWSIATARELGAPELYLTVFDHNERAKRFYSRHGFTEIGRCTFQLGERIDDDRVWRLSLAT